MSAPVPQSRWARVKERASARLASRLWPAADIVSGDDSYSVDFIAVRVGDDDYFIPRYASHRPACTAFLRGQVYEPMTHALVRRLLARFPGDMVHAGTFFGDMLPSFSSACQGTVYAFEPVLENYVLAKLCVQRNGIENVLLLNAALGEGTSIGRIDVGTDKGEHRGGSSRIGDTGQITSIVTIDSFAPAKLSLIQLDVEGFELNALKGAAATIARWQPIILVEDNEGNCSPFLEQRGYKKVGEVPGLKVWSIAAHFDAVASELSQAISSSQ